MSLPATKAPTGLHEWTPYSRSPDCYMSVYVTSSLCCMQYVTIASSQISVSNSIVLKPEKNQNVIW